MNEIIKRMTNGEAEPEQKIEKTVKVNYDGRQYFIRIPKKISDYFKIQKGDIIELTANIKFIKKEKRKILVAELIEEE